jgi:hypothetical protein
MTQARRRLGPGPLRELFFLLRGPSPHSARWKGLLVAAVDGTILTALDPGDHGGPWEQENGQATACPPGKRAQEGQPLAGPITKTDVSTLSGEPRSCSASGVPRASAMRWLAALACPSMQWA